MSKFASAYCDICAGTGRVWIKPKRGRQSMVEHECPDCAFGHSLRQEGRRRAQAKRDANGICELLGLNFVEADMPEGLECVLVSEDGWQAAALTSDGVVHGPFWRNAEGGWQKERPAP